MTKDDSPIRNEEDMYHFSRRKPKPDKVIDESGRSTEWLEVEDSYKYQQRSCDQLKK